MPLGVDEVVRTPLGLDITAVVVAATFGALIALERRFDVVGVVGLALAFGLGGGIARDILLAQVPIAVTNDAYFVTATGVGLVVFLVRPASDRLVKGLDVLDAFALGIYTIASASKALNAGVSIVPAAFIGVIAGVAGGVICDVLSGRLPRIFLTGSKLYSVAAAAGSGAFVALDALGSGRAVAAVVGIGVAVGLRLLALRFDLVVPTPTGVGPRLTGRGGDG